MSRMLQTQSLLSAVIIETGIFGGTVDDYCDGTTVGDMVVEADCDTCCSAGYAVGSSRMYIRSTLVG